MPTKKCPVESDKNATADATTAKQTDTLRDGDASPGKHDSVGGESPYRNIESTNIQR